MNDVTQRDVLSPEGLTQLVDGMLATQAEYETASGGGDFAMCDALMADAWTKLRAHDAALRDRLVLLEQSEDMSGGCFAMIHQTLEAFGTNMDGTPPMFFNDAVAATIWRYVDMMASGELERDPQQRMSGESPGKLYHAYRRVDGKMLNEPRREASLSVGSDTPKEKEPKP